MQGSSSAVRGRQHFHASDCSAGVLAVRHRLKAGSRRGLQAPAGLQTLQLCYRQPNPGDDVQSHTTSALGWVRGVCAQPRVVAGLAGKLRDPHHASHSVTEVSVTAVRL